MDMECFAIKIKIISAKRIFIHTYSNADLKLKFIPKSFMNFYIRKVIFIIF